MNASAKRTFVFIRYLYPLFAWLVSALAAGFETVYYIYEGQVYLNSFSLYSWISAFWKFSLTQNESSPLAVGLLRFSIVFAVILGLLSLFLTAYTAVCSVAALSLPPLDKRANLYKNYFRLFLWYRGSTETALALLVPVSLLPYVYVAVCGLYGETAQVCYDGLPLIAVTLTLSVIGFILVFVSKRFEKELHLDMFTKYKPKPNKN